MINTRLSVDEKADLVELIKKAIVARYDGEVELLGEDQDGGSWFVPVCDDMECALELWTLHVFHDAIEQARRSLVEDGAPEWPHADYDTDRC